MKYLLISAFCFAVAGCASSGGGDVVGNGLTGNPSRTQIMDTDQGGTCGGGASCNAESATCCDHMKSAAPGDEADCGCGHPEHHKAKGKAKKAK